MNPATRERIERIAEKHTPASYGGFEPSAVKEMLVLALTALCEEMEREKTEPVDALGEIAKWSFDLTLSCLTTNGINPDLRNCDSTCKECT